MQKKYCVSSSFGIMHVQQAYQLCCIARQYADASLMLEKGNMKISGKQMIGILSLMIHGGDELIISATGDQAANAIFGVEQVLMGAPYQTIA